MQEVINVSMRGKSAKLAQLSNRNVQVVHEDCDLSQAPKLLPMQTTH